MATTIKIKRGNSKPKRSQLAQGELALNEQDQVLYIGGNGNKLYSVNLTLSNFTKISNVSNLINLLNTVGLNSKTQIEEGTSLMYVPVDDDNITDLTHTFTCSNQAVLQIGSSLDNILIYDPGKDMTLQCRWGDYAPTGTMSDLNPDFTSVIYSEPGNYFWIDGHEPLYLMWVES